VNTKYRRKTYAKGGMFAVTSRILQVDLLTERRLYKLINTGCALLTNLKFFRLRKSLVW
jgi:hypothetical protein